MHSKAMSALILPLSSYKYTPRTNICTMTPSSPHPRVAWLPFYRAQLFFLLFLWFLFVCWSKVALTLYGRMPAGAAAAAAAWLAAALRCAALALHCCSALFYSAAQLPATWLLAADGRCSLPRQAASPPRWLRCGWAGAKAGIWSFRVHFDVLTYGSLAV